MKLNIPAPNIERSAELEEKLFGIADLALVFEVLRAKMYSNPIQSLVREYMSNARDSHVEAGIPDRPIEVVLPNHIESYFKVRDFGVGISPERIDNIFLKFGASTKREDDSQIGGFGFGSKTGFAYSDSFSVITRFDGVQRNYCLFIDETRIGACSLLSETETKEGNGTEIIIPVKPEDFGAFIDATEKVGRHWKVKPIVKGENFSFRSPEKVIEGTNWFLSKGDRYSYNRDVKLLIGEIEYPFDLYAVRDLHKDHKSVMNSLHGMVYLQFDIGDGLSLSSSREQLFLNDQTKEKISARLSEFEKALKGKIQEKVEAQSDFFSANLFACRNLTELIFDPVQFFGTDKMSWKGINLFGKTHVPIKCDNVHFSRNSRGKQAIVRSTGCYLNFENGGKLFVNDLGLLHLTPKHVKKFFDDNPEIKSVQILCPNEKCTIDNLNESIHLDKMEYGLLSSITDGKGAQKKISKPKLQVFKFEGGRFGRSSHDAKEKEEASPKVLCLLTKENHLNWRQIYLNGKRIDSYTLQLMQNFSKEAVFYGVDHDAPKDRIEEEFEDFVELGAFIDQVLDGKEEEVVRSTFFQQLEYDHELGVFCGEIEVFRKRLNSESSFLKCLEITNTIRKEKNKESFSNVYCQIRGSADIEKKAIEFGKNHPEFDLETLNEECEEKYPLLKFLNTYRYGKEFLSEYVAEYVELKDKEILKGKEK